MSIVIISFTCCFLQIYDDFYGPFFNDISGGILNDYLQRCSDKPLHNLPLKEFPGGRATHISTEKYIYTV